MQEYLTFLSFKGKNTVLTPQKYAKNHLTNLTAPNLVVKDTEHRYLYSSNRLLKQDYGSNLLYFSLVFEVIRTLYAR